MPLTQKGEKIRSAMEKEYGKEKGESVFYASKNKGTISGVDAARGDAGFEEGDHPRAKDGKFTSVMEKKGGGEHVQHYDEEPEDEHLNAQAKKAGWKKGDLFPSFDVYDKERKWAAGGGGHNSGYVDSVEDISDLRARMDGVRALCDTAAARMDEWSEEARKRKP